MLLRFLIGFGFLGVGSALMVLAAGYRYRPRLPEDPDTIRIRRQRVQTSNWAVPVWAVERRQWTAQDDFLALADYHHKEGVEG